MVQEADFIMTSAFFIMTSFATEAGPCRHIFGQYGQWQSKLF